MRKHLPLSERLVRVVQDPVPRFGPRDFLANLGPKLLWLLDGPPERVIVDFAVERIRPVGNVYEKKGGKCYSCWHGLTFRAPRIDANLHSSSWKLNT